MTGAEKNLMMVNEKEMEGIYNFRQLFTSKHQYVGEKQDKMKKRMEERRSKGWKTKSETHFLSVMHPNAFQTLNQASRDQSRI